MAAISNPESIVTLKVCHDNTTRKCKLPLRDLGAASLEGKLRAFLDIPADSDCLFERYSDSAAAYIVLDPSNTAIYKQLYRAAKAKLKLKIRVTNKSQPAVERAISKPKPVTVEDQPETFNRNPLAERQSQTSRESQSEMAPADTPIVGKTKSNVELKKTVSAHNHSHPFSVCCNNCDVAIPGSHFHCSTCDNGDFDLCQSCVDIGMTCYNAEHWLIKRTMMNGIMRYSTTENIKPKSHILQSNDASSINKSPSIAVSFRIPAAKSSASGRLSLDAAERTCNSCLRDFPERSFLHCTSCDDYDLCVNCFAREVEGHHPNHAFIPAVSGSIFPKHVVSKLGPARNVSHNAICDGCDVFIAGVRHKCLDCPDWDYCSPCAVNADLVHPGHRFVPVYDPLPENYTQNLRPVHLGICCDGPLCYPSNRQAPYITGIRYKCAVCHDLDFCGTCEACPSNSHNKTHPLIKFKTPVRHVSVTTNGESEDGQKLQVMGDRHVRISVNSRATETIVKSQAEPLLSNPISMNSAITVLDVTPSDADSPKAASAIVEEPPKAESGLIAVDVKRQTDSNSAGSDTSPIPIVSTACWATYIRDTVMDGSCFPPDYVFEQTWVLRNTGVVAWPANCAVKFVGGDYMGLLLSNRPAGTKELLSASESTVCREPLLPHQEFAFSVSLRTPTRPGLYVSYWRLSTEDGVKFGDRLWCEVDVKPQLSIESATQVEHQASNAPMPLVTAAEVVKEEHVSEPLGMIFPKLEQESPESSVHATCNDTNEAVITTAELGESDIEDDWAGSEIDFLTDEEYDILDASDEEYLNKEQKKLLKQ